ncbi:ABC transporter ATP-binding protein [Salidesulfovibrio brasiliensis]|uniref:ABC transporter ATP-binding protein n=1 Tax=Salidesulfovibrio brasiliensis TaxID=221711 RepID=UPI0006CF89BC|nr:ABC transporter ATP-binding protein [Salidesulfovibrio brasiliensis]
MILTVNNVSFSYASTPVLENVDFHVDPGEILAIMGPNGAGKTTLLKCVNAIHRPSSGAVMVDGTDVLRLTAEQTARRVGYVAQKTETGNMTAFDAVLLGRKPHMRWRVSENDLRIVEAAIRHLGMEHLTMRTLDHMSGGEVQKVAIARALVQEPRILILDEPTSALDMKNRTEILGMIGHVVREHGMAAVVTLHDVNQALRFADRFIFLRDRTIFAAAKRGEVTAEMIEGVYGLPVVLGEVNGLPVVVPADETIRPHKHDHTETMLDQ